MADKKIKDRKDIKKNPRYKEPKKKEPPKKKSFIDLITGRGEAIGDALASAMGTKNR